MGGVYLSTYIVRSRRDWHRRYFVRYYVRIRSSLTYETPSILAHSNLFDYRLVDYSILRSPYCMLSSTESSTQSSSGLVTPPTTNHLSESMTDAPILICALVL